MRAFIAGCAASTLTGTIALADPVGKYDVVGTNPGGSTYSGSVTKDPRHLQDYLEYRRHNGTGIGNDEFIAVSSASGGTAGLALPSEQGDEWKGIWTYGGGRSSGRKSGQEIGSAWPWTRFFAEAHGLYDSDQRQ